MKSFQNIVQIVTAFHYYFGINVKMHKKHYEMYNYLKY